MPIINPWLFYLIDLLSNVEIVTELCIALAIGIVIVTKFIELEECDFLEKEEINRYRNIRKRLCVVGVISILLNVAMPSKETMYTMIVARNVTYENVEIASETIKDSVDYIIEKMKGE